MKRGGLQQDEQGFASLVVGIVLVIVLALMTIGFAELMRNELNQVTNRQLSSQAYYAAESGINDAIQAVKQDPTYTKTSCPALQPSDSSYGAFGKYLGNSHVSGDQNSAWTCLLIDPNPTSLEYGSVDTETPTTFVTTAQDNTNGAADGVGTIDVYWQDASGGTGFQSTDGATSNSAFPASGSWAGTGVLRFAITPLPGNGVSMNRTSLVNNTFTAFLYPADQAHSSVQSALYSAAGTGSHAATGVVIDGNCSTSGTPDHCHARITVSSGQIAAAGDPILFVLRSVYAKTNVYISGTDGANGSGDKVDFLGVQTLIDSTGRAQDVLKRLQVRVPQQNSDIPFPGFAGNGTNSLCKNLQGVYPGGTITDVCP